ncbi:MAG: sulfite exporter TauE/SafE family protein [Candidatus Omnitrophica bacterium]|nr:sulfite exporter TauE/SafE family protein [Candidatus Omnitrophota bacterium]
MNIVLYIILGLLAGVFSGIFGIGGGLVIVPALVLLAGFTQHQAQGTTLALLVPPIGLLAAIRYYQAGNVNLFVAALICVGFIAGSYFGADWVQKLSDPVLKKAFGVFLFLISMNMIFMK